MMKRLLAALIALASLSAVPVFADQDTLCLPTSGTVSGLTIVTDINAALKAIVTSHSGDTAPANDCTAAPVEGQVWLDSSGSQPVWKIYDGAAWEILGTVNASSGQWQPPIGGGATSLASASTTDLWSVPQSAVTVTGTTTITQLGSSSAVTGTVKFVAFSGVLTLTHDGTKLILPTGANITTAAGDRAAVLSLGGNNVAVLSYSRASGAPLANPVVIGDSGSGGTAGVVPAPPSGYAAIGKVLSADGTFSGNTVPVGASFPYAGLTAPGGYLMEYGQAVSRSTYSGLWAVLHSSATVTVTIASPAIVTWTGHPLSVGSPVSFATTGALPTGLSAATTYYVISAGYGTNSFEVSTSVGGSAVNTSGSQSGTHTGTYAPYGAGDFSTTFNIPDMRGRVVAAADNMGGTSANRLTAPATTGSIDGDVLGNAGGQESHVQTTAELVAHSHTATASGARHGANGTSIGTAWPAADGDQFNPSAAAALTTSTVGSSTAFNVVQPTLIQNYIIRY